MSKTLISWTDETANPLTGCTECDPACLNCYARAASASPRLQQFEKYHGVVDEKGRWTSQINFAPDVLDKLLKKKKPCKIFMPSMSDLFHPGVKDEWIDQIMAAIALTPHITYQVLTKRPERMLEYFSKFQDWQTHLGDTGAWASNMADLACDRNWRKYHHLDGNNYSSDECYEELKTSIHSGYFENLWIGVTAGTQKSAEDRIPLLLQTPAAVRFVSVEPMLEEMDISEWLHLLPCPQHPNERAAGWGHLPCDCRDWFNKHVASGNLSSISQIIIGGESGPNSRPFHLEWAQSLIEQCHGTNTKVFMKQVGSNAFYQGKPFKTKSRAGSDPSEWPEWAQVQEFPNN